MRRTNQPAQEHQTVPTSKPSDYVDTSPLHSRLAALRRRFYFIVTFRGLSCVLAVLLAIAVFSGFLDWLVHLPGLIRAAALVGGLCSAAFVGVVCLGLPLRKRADNLSLALRVEEHYPILNDSLASTVEFMQQPAEAEKLGSAALRREAVQRALRKVQTCNFNRVIDSRGTVPAGLCLAGFAGLAVGLFVLSPVYARTALLRLADPFGDHAWPRRTQLEIAQYRSRIGRNEPFDVNVTVRGVVPEEGVVTFRFKGTTVETRKCKIVPGDDPNTGVLKTRLDPNRVPRDFTFQVSANDASSAESKVEVLPPPTLTLLEGRDSPQVRLQYPRYTELADKVLPAGVGNVETVAGTLVTMRAAVDMPLKQAWISYEPELKYADLVAYLGTLTTQHPVQTLALSAGGRTVWDHVPAVLEAGSRVFTVPFMPRVSGSYFLHLEEERAGLRASRQFELRVLADPAPVVTLERPSSIHDSLNMVSGADLNLEAIAEDRPPGSSGIPVHAIRSVYLEYRCKKSDPPRRLQLYSSTNVALAVTAASMVGSRSPWSMAVPPRMRLQRIELGQKLPLNQFKHIGTEKADLRDGDILTFQVCADDFDDVTVDKQPGRSHEVEIHIVSRDMLEAILSKDQTALQQELVRLRELEREAIKKVTEAQKRANDPDNRTRSEIPQLLQEAEELQRQIREKVGTDREGLRVQAEGLRAEAQRLLQTMRDNHLPRSTSEERIGDVASELSRLAKAELQQIEPRLTDARKQIEMNPGQPQSVSKPKGPLTEARKQQEQVAQSLDELLKRLEPWSTLVEVKGESRIILQEQRRIQEETKQAQPRSIGQDSDKLPPELKNDLERLQESQSRLQERTQQLLDKMDRMSKEREERSRKNASRPEEDMKTAEDLREAREAAMQDGAVTDDMKEAAKGIKENQLGPANDKQRESIKKLEAMVKKLEDQPAKELERLSKKLEEADKALAELEEKQDRLSKEAKKANQITDPQQRAAEFRRIADELKALRAKRQEAEELLQQLSRLRSQDAGQALEQAGKEMDQAVQRLERGENPDKEEDEALDRLQEARRQLKRAQQEVEEELAREQIVKVADQIRRLKERQEGFNKDFERIQRELAQPGKEKRAQWANLQSLADNQKSLGDETESLSKSQQLARAKVFIRVLGKAQESMAKASEKMVEHRKEGIAQDSAETAAGEEAATAQREALRYLEQLANAVKAEEQRAQRPAQQAGGDDEGGGGGGGMPAGGDDIISQLTQLKLLRTLQADVNKRTDRFANQHPDPEKLTEPEKLELQSIHREQREVADLLDQLLAPPEPEGAKP